MLKIVGVPIGNIEDFSIRAIKALYNCDVVIAEDTRNYLKLRSILESKMPQLLKTLGTNQLSRPKLVSYTEEKHKRNSERIIEELKSGKEGILISDAGMPLISDPGFRLVSDLLLNGVGIEVIPASTALVPALILSGLPSDRFIFGGFFPRTAGKIIKLLKSYDVKENTLIFYESPYRIVKSLKIIAKEYPGINVAAVSEITKKFEKVIKGKISVVIENLLQNKILGEWTVIMRELE